VTNGTTFTTVDVPGALYTYAYGINAAGQIVETFYDAMGYSHGFVTDGATFTTVDVPDRTGTTAYGINMAGQIVGTFDDDTGTHGFVATPKR
jgi:probable HAF family extracellular repeat protein